MFFFQIINRLIQRSIQMEIKLDIYLHKKETLTEISQTAFKRIE